MSPNQGARSCHRRAGLPLVLTAGRVSHRDCCTTPWQSGAPRTEKTARGRLPVCHQEAAGGAQRQMSRNGDPLGKAAEWLHGERKLRREKAGGVLTLGPATKEYTTASRGYTTVPAHEQHRGSAATKQAGGPRLVAPPFRDEAKQGMGARGRRGAWPVAAVGTGVDDPECFVRLPGPRHHRKNGRTSLSS